MFAIDPCDGFALAEVEQLRTVAERIEARPAGGQCPAEAPPARQVERLRTAQDEGDDVLWFAILVAVDPECAGALVVIGLHLEADIAALVAIHLGR